MTRSLTKKEKELTQAILDILEDCDINETSMILNTVCGIDCAHFFNSEKAKDIKVREYCEVQNCYHKCTLAQHLELYKYDEPFDIYKIIESSHNLNDLIMHPSLRLFIKLSDNYKVTGNVLELKQKEKTNDRI